MLYIPEIIELHKISTDVTLSHQNTRNDETMDFGTHSRETGDATTKLLTVKVVLNQEQYNVFSAWFDIARSQYFFSTFPDVNNPTIEKGKFYYFSFEKVDIQVNKKSRKQFEIELPLYWHFRVPPTERV